MDKVRNFFKNKTVQSIITSLLCIIVGLFIGFIVLLCINPAGAWQGITDLIKNFFTFSQPASQVKHFGNTLVKTVPLLMCSLSILFCYKVGLFNIGAAGQYVIGAGLSLYAALAWSLPWYACIILAAVGAAVWGMLVGFLKAYCNVNEVISGIMLNWISLYLINMLLTNVKEPTSPYTRSLGKASTIPSLGLETLFNNNKYVTIAIPMAIVFVIIIWLLLDKTKFGYELRATGLNKHAAKYSGMSEKRNIIVSLAIGGALAGIGAALLYLSGIEQWSCSQSSVPGMGFNGIAAAFLGGLNPIGSIFSSYFIQHITAGGAYVDKTMYSSQITDLISAIIIYLCGFVFFVKYMMNKSIAKREAAAAKKAAEAEKKEEGEKE